MATTRGETLPHAAPPAGEEAAPSVSVVVPLYNEAASVVELYRRTVESLDAFGRSYELIFIDDGSTDTTFAELERLHDADGRVRAVRFKRNFGQHSAMHAGTSSSRWTATCRTVPKTLPG